MHACNLHCRPKFAETNKLSPALYPILVLAIFQNVFVIALIAMASASWQATSFGGMHAFQNNCCWVSDGHAIALRRPDSTTCVTE